MLFWWQYHLLLFLLFSNLLVISSPNFVYPCLSGGISSVGLNQLRWEACRKVLWWGWEPHKGAQPSGEEDSTSKQTCWTTEGRWRPISQLQFTLVSRQRRGGMTRTNWLLKLWRAICLLLQNSPTKIISILIPQILVLTFYYFFFPVASWIHQSQSRNGES
jgi:hypothetical protein